MPTQKKLVDVCRTGSGLCTERPSSQPKQVDAEIWDARALLSQHLRPRRITRALRGLLFDPEMGERTLLCLDEVLARTLAMRAAGQVYMDVGLEYPAWPSRFTATTR